MERLNSEGDELFRKIYEPQVVAIPPVDASSGLCVTPDGEIRVYGNIGAREYGETGTPVCLSSGDCGISWKLRPAPEGSFLGSAGYNPATGRYISFYPNVHRPELRFELSGAYAVLSDSGFDSTDNRFVKLSDKPLHILRLPYFSERLGRWFILGEYTRPEDRKKFAAVCFSDDDGESWESNILTETAPAFETAPPHKGTRWQQYSCEPTLTELSDGRLMLLVRTSQNFHYVYYSCDGGVIWSRPEPSIFHATATMPTLYRLDDGRILLFWCNNQPLPELDHEKTWPPLTDDIKSGIWEDVFTNRDANDLAISQDDGASWSGFRELFLNPIRNSADFRSAGGICMLDKSIHQAQLLELPYNKLLVHFGQHPLCRRIVLLDLDWLYETERSEDFRYGMSSVSTHMYVRSNLGSYRGFSGHCSYNRTDGALLLPDPDGNYREVLQLARTDDDRLVYQKQGAVWNFPASERGEVTVTLRVCKSGVALSLCDHWYNPCDETAAAEAPFSFKYSTVRRDGWDTLRFVYDTGARRCEVYVNGVLTRELEMTGSAPYGLCYLHIQTLAEKRDLEGTLIKQLEKHNV